MLRRRPTRKGWHVTSATPTAYVDHQNLMTVVGIMGILESCIWRAWTLGATGLLCGLAVTAQAEDVHIPMHGIGAGTFYVEVEVARLGGVDFLVDTGSGYTAIDAGMLKDIQRSGDAEFVKQLEGIMADGRRMVVPVYRISEIRLGACVLRGVEAAVFDEGTRPILGMKALTRVAPFTFSTSPPGIRLSRCDAVITADRAADAGTMRNAEADVLQDAG